MRGRIVAAIGLTALALCTSWTTMQASGAIDSVDPLSPTERAWIDANGPIRYAPDPDYPPFEFVQDGEIKGINLDFLNRMSRNLDIEFEIVLYDNWTRVLEAMQAREVHMLGSLAQTEDRETYMDFIGPYMSLGEVFYVNVGRTDLVAVDALSGKRIAVVQDYAAATWLAENRPDMVQVPVPDILSGLEAVSTGTVDGFFENVPVAGYTIRERSINNVRILGEPLYYSPANWAVTQDDTVLANIVAKGLQSIPLGEQSAIFEYWSGYDLGVAAATPKGPLFSPLSLAVVGSLALVLVAAGAWTTTLQRAVRSRTEDLRVSNAHIQQANEDLASRLQTRSNELHLLLEREGRIYEALEKQAQDSVWAFDRCAWILQNRYHGILNAETQEAVRVAQSSAWKLTELLAATKDTASSEPQEIAETMRLGPLLKEAIHEHEKRHGHAMNLECPDDLTVDGAPNDLRRLTAHFVAFAAATDPPAAFLRVRRTEAGEVEVLLPNVGPVAHPESLLEPLGADAMGLSLPAAARIVHRTGGDIRVEQTPHGLAIILHLADPSVPPEP